MARPIQANPISARPIQANPIGSAGPSYPPILDTALVWLDGSTLVSSGADITDWLNKGTGGAQYDLTTSVSNYPQIGSFNGNAIATTTSGSNTPMFPVSPTLLSQPNTIFVVCKWDALPAGFDYLFDGYDGSARHFLAMRDTSTDTIIFAGTILSSGVGSWTTAPLVAELTFDGANSDFILTDFDTGFGDSGNQDLNYIRLFTHNSGDPSHEGWIGSFVLFNSLVAAQDKLDIRTYYKSLFGIAA